MKMEIFRNYPIGNKVELVERLLDRGVLADATRKITRNRQPGRCCVAGCQMTELPATAAVPLPKPSASARPAAPAPADADSLTK
jgi:4-hydroxybutyryl-CoA dehydratase/vinylacetyl-CoA-Delta-isomerase